MRIRSIKPEFWSHPVMQKQSDSTKLMALGLLNYADDEGYFYADLNLIRSAIRPLDDNSKIVRRCIDDLSTIGYVQLFQSSDHGEIGFVVSFRKHQRVDRPSMSAIKELIISTNDRRMIDDESKIVSDASRARADRIGKERIGKDSLASESLSCELIQTLWNAERLPDWPYCRDVGAKRLEHCNARLKEIPYIDDWREAIGQLKRDQWWLKNGNGDKHANWRPSFDFIIQPGRVTALLEKAATWTALESRPDEDEDPYAITDADVEEENRRLADERH